MITREDMDHFETDPMEMVKEFAHTLDQEPNPSLYDKLIQEEYSEWEDAACYGSKMSELKELADLVYVIFGYANARNWDLGLALYRIHKNNLGRCIQPDGSIKRRGDGKIIKNKGYPKPYLEDLV